MSKGSSSSIKCISNPNEAKEESAFDVRRGPWTLEEDKLLIHYITCNGEGRWNTLAKCAGLKRTGKSCRLRWLNYLKPDIKRGNLTPQEQLLILELHAKWGNRWSKIAKHLPGRTDNEIKNYWRTRVQKQARQLNVDSNSKKFLEAIRRHWMPRLLEKEGQNSSLSSSSSISSISTTDNQDPKAPPLPKDQAHFPTSPKLMDSSNLDKEKRHKKCSSLSDSARAMQLPASQVEDDNPRYTVVECRGNSSSAYSSLMMIKDECYQLEMMMNGYDAARAFTQPELSAMESHQDIAFSECQVSETADWLHDDIPETTFWNMDELWHFRKPEEVGI